MTTNVLLKLGDYKFSINSASFNELSKTSKYKWQSIERLGQVSALQFTGADNPTIQLTGTLYPYLGAGLKQIDNLNDNASKGKPLMLVDGLGNVHGYWCITQIEERHSALCANGTPRKITFNLGIIFYGNNLQNS